MAKQRVSAEDVAQAAGVSRTTVSFVLNNTPGKSITETTRQRVLEAAADLGYIPNEDARRLARIRSRTIGLFICHSQFVYSDVFITRVLEGMSQAANRYRARLVVQPVSLRDTDYREIAARDRAEGIVLINAHDEDPALLALARDNFPTVSMDYLDDVPIDQVYVDNVAAATEITEYLVGLGHRRIAIITHAPLLFLSARNRLAGYRSALENAGLVFDPSLVRHGDFSEQSGFLQMQDLLGSTSGVTAVFAGNDVVAYGVLQAVHQAGLDVPRDISIAGFDDDYMSRFLNPPLTTMVLPAAGHGSAAVEALMNRLQRDQADVPAPPLRRLLRAHISVRESCGPPRLQNASG
jgi:DNA-binding LacI/PurR family transcriptional regulator